MKLAGDPTPSGPYIEIATTPAAIGEVLSWTGFDAQGYQTGLIAPAGVASDGLAKVVSLEQSGQFSDAFYLETAHFNSLPNSLGPLQSASQGILQKQPTLLNPLRTEWYAMWVANGGDNVTGLGFALKLNNPNVMAQIVAATAPSVVPEPTSLMLVGGALGLGALRRTRRTLYL